MKQYMFVRDDECNVNEQTEKQYIQIYFLKGNKMLGFLKKINVFLIKNS